MACGSRARTNTERSAPSQTQEIFRQDAQRSASKTASKIGWSIRLTVQHWRWGVRLLPLWKIIKMKTEALRYLLHCRGICDLSHMRKQEVKIRK